MATVYTGYAFVKTMGIGLNSTTAFSGNPAVVYGVAGATFSVQPTFATATSIAVQPVVGVNVISSLEKDDGNGNSFFNVLSGNQLTAQFNM